MSSEDIRIDSITADEQHSDDRNSIYFSTIRSRHADHYFADLQNSQVKPKKGIIRYSEYDKLNANKTSIYPNLILNRLSFSKDIRSSADKVLLRMAVLKQEFHNVSFELSTGDIMAIMYTKEADMISLLKVISGSSSHPGKIGGDILINGHRMTNDRLEKTIGFVSTEPARSSLTIRQYLRISAVFCPPMSSRYGGVNHLINKLLSDLSLIPVCDIACSRLNRSQWQRVKVAAQLIRDPTILLCTDILKDIDIHDQCFLIDYLREWAIKSNRIVIMGMSPTAFEVLKMFSKVLILASGRVVYFGAPTAMPQYFESIGCPCPAYKNICDYYVDLVTHDNLTAEASRESSVRIARLVNKWNSIAPASKRPSGKVLLDLRNGRGYAKMIGLFAIFWFDFCNNRISRILTTLLIFLISSILSVYHSDLSLILPESFLQRQSFMDFALFYYPLLIGLIHLKRARHRLKELFKLTVVRCYCNSTLLIVCIFLGMLPSILVATLSFTIPSFTITDFHKKSGNSSFLSLNIPIFLNIVCCHFISTTFSHFSSEIFANFCFILTWVLLYFSTGLITNVSIFVKTTNPVQLGSMNLFKFLYQETSKLENVSSPNLTSPMKLYSCGRTFLNTTQMTKGPCQKVSSAELISYYGYKREEWFQSTGIVGFLTNNVLLIFVLSNFLVFGISLLLFHWNRSKLLKKVIRK